MMMLKTKVIWQGFNTSAF